MSERLLVMIPAWNEAGNLAAVTAELREVLGEVDILVVDDASTDGTAGEARRLGCRVVALPFRLGYGGALQAGVKFGLRAGYRVVVTFDADGQHDPRDVPALVEAVCGGTEVAIGSRFLAPGAHAGSWIRRAGRRLFATLARACTGLPLTDPTSGLKALGPRGQALFALSRFPDRFPDADALVLASRARLPVAERPAHMRPSRNRHSMHDGHRAVTYAFNMFFSLLVARMGDEGDLKG